MRSSLLNQHRAARRLAAASAGLVVILTTASFQPTYAAELLAQENRQTKPPVTDNGLPTVNPGDLTPTSPSKIGDLQPLELPGLNYNSEFPPPKLAMPVPLPHDKNKTMSLGPMQTGELIQIAKLHPIRLEASYNEPITLRDALTYTLQNNLPIAINLKTFESSKYGYYAALAGFLPSISTNYTYTHTNIFPSTSSNGRTFSESVNLPVFQGGKVLYGTMSSFYRMKAARHQYYTSINDTLLNAYTAYTNLLLQRALLQIRIKSVEVDQEQLRLNEQLFYAGTGTRFAVMQSQTQLALDKQALLQQQVTVRQAALQLAYVLNLPLGVNLVPVETSVTESGLVDETLSINDLLNLSLAHRPELRQYEYLRLAASRNVQVAASQLYPTAQWNITYNHQSTSVHNSNSGGLASAAANAGGSVYQSPFGGLFAPAVGVTTAGSPVVNGTGTGVSQLTPGTGGLNVTPGATNTTLGTTTGAATSGAGGSTVTTVGSGASGSFGSAAASSGSTQVGGSNVASVGVFGGIFNSVTFQFNLNWTLGNLGASGAAQILAARAVARQSLIQANQVLLQVDQQVRSSYLNALTAREQIDVTAAGVASGAEELRLARLRVQMGVGTNLELIQAQRDYIQALVNQAQAIIASNQAQAQLLHDTGLVSLDTLIHGYRRRSG